VSYFTQRSQSPKAQDLNFALLGLLCTSHFDSNKTRPGGNDRAKSRIQLVNGFSDLLETIDEVMEAVKNDNLFRETGAVSMTSVHVRHPHWHGPLVYNDTCKEGFSKRPLLHQLGIAVCFAILAGFMTTVIVVEATLAWELFGNK
jgi:hypothetical protein